MNHLVEDKSIWRSTRKGSFILRSFYDLVSRRRRAAPLPAIEVTIVPLMLCSLLEKNCGEGVDPGQAKKWISIS